MTATIDSSTFTPATIDCRDFELQLIFCLPSEEDPFGDGHEEAREAYQANGAKVRGNGCTQCDLCGAHYKMGALFLHLPTGLLVSMGHTCAANVGLGICGERWRALVGRSNARKAQHERARYAALERARNVEAVKESLRRLTPAERVLVRLAREERLGRNLREDLRRTGRLSEAQWSLLLRVGSRVQEARTAPAPATEWPLAEGRIEVEATIVAVFQRQQDFGPKWILAIDGPSGRTKLWGNCPSIIWEEHKWETLGGKRVRFRAVVEQSERDVAFGFVKRPTKVALVD